MLALGERLLPLIALLHRKPANAADLPEAQAGVMRMCLRMATAVASSVGAVMDGMGDLAETADGEMMEYGIGITTLVMHRGCGECCASAASPKLYITP